MSSKYMPFKKTALAVLVGSLLSGCIELGGDDSSDDEVQDDQPQEEQRVSITGFAVKGILAGAIVEAYDITGNTLLATTITDADGKYTLPSITHDGPILVKLKTAADTMATCDSAVGCDDGSGTPVPFGSKYTFNDSNFNLSAVLPDASVADDQELMVTPITHMAAERVQAAADAGETIDSSAVQGINNATATLLGLDGVDINTVPPVDITDVQATSEGSADQQLYAALLASIQTIAEQDPEATIADVVNDLATDYAEDGGLVSNSEDAAKITLEEIFVGATEVVEIVEAEAVEEGVELDLGEAGSTLDLAESEAKNAEPDAEVIVEPEPEPEPEPTLTLSTATQKGIALLNDLNTWQDALQADNQTLTQPFEDQLEGTGDILESLDAQSKVLQEFSTLIVREEDVTECFATDSMTGVCIASDTYTESEAGPIFGIAGVVASLAGLTEKLQDSLAVDVADSSGNTFNYTTQVDDIDGINIEDINDVISEEDVLAYDLVATYSIKEGKIDSITYVMSDLAAKPVFDTDFTVTLTQTDFDDDGLQIAFNVTNAVANIPSESLVLSVLTGSASLTFETAAARKAFSADESELDPSLASVTAVDVHLAARAVKTDTTVSPAVTTTANLNIDLDYDRAADDTTVTTAAFGLDMTNSNGESIDGDLIFTVNGDFSETEVALEGFQQTLDMTGANAVFNGEVTIAGADAAGIVQSATFSGSIDAEVGFFAPVVDEEQIAKDANADFEGMIEITSGTKTTSFTGSASVFMEAVTTPDGTPFSLGDGTEYHVNKVELFGRLKADQGTEDADPTAGLSINAVVNANIAGLQFNPVTLPENGDVVGQLNYGIKSLTADSAEIYLNRKDALDASIASLTAINAMVDSDNGHHAQLNSSNAIVSFARSNCSTPANNAYHLCDVVSTDSFKRNKFFPTAVTEAEALATMQADVDNEYNPYGNIPAPTLVTNFTTTGGDAVVEHGECFGDLTPETLLASCVVSRTYNTTIDIPTDIAHDFDRNYYARGLDFNQPGGNSVSLAVSDCAEYAADVTMQECTLASSHNENQGVGPWDDIPSLQASLESTYSGQDITGLTCDTNEDGYGHCEYTRTGYEQIIVDADLTAASILTIQYGKHSYGSYSYNIEPNCETAACALTMTSHREISLPAGLTPAERETYFAAVEDGYVNRTDTLTLEACETFDNGAMDCRFNQSQVYTHNSVMNDLGNGLTKFIAFIAQNLNIFSCSVNFNQSLESDYGWLNVVANGSADMNFTGDIAAGETEDKTMPVKIEYFDPRFDAEKIAAGEGAFVQMSANVSIKANLTGLENAEIAIFANRLGKEDAEGTIKLINGTRAIELNVNSTQALNTAEGINLVIRNQDAEMTIMAICATDENDAGVYDNEHIAACADGIFFQGAVHVGGFKVADLEDRDGLSVFRFSDGTGLDLVATPNFVVQPSAP